MNHLKIDPARHFQGLAAYRGGQSLADVTETVNSFEAMHENALTDEEHRAIANAPQSFMLGYADGLIEDFRAVVGALTSRRPSLRA